jgi:TetR/AcrR family tetracycline transcriptional repressor
MSTLVARGLPLRRARLTVLVVVRLTIGQVVEEQAPPPDPEAVASFDAEDLARCHPTLTAGITEYFQEGRTVDDLFRDSLELVLRQR